MSWTEGPPAGPTGEGLVPLRRPRQSAVLLCPRAGSDRKTCLSCDLLTAIRRHDGSMHTFLVDETNKDFKENLFFIVGGLVFTESQIVEVDAAVKQRRSQFGYRSGDRFKFNTRERADHISPEDHREAKRLLIGDLKNIGARLIVSVVLHDLARNTPFDDRMRWGLNTLAQAYHSLLCHDAAQGIFLMDRDNDRFDHLEHMF